MSAHTIEELRKHMETVDRYCPAQAKQINSALDELEAFRAAKSEHKRTRREIRKLAKFVQWSPESMVEERERLKQALKYEGDVAGQAIDDLKKARAEVDRLKNNLVVRENQLRAQGLLESENAALSVRLSEFCWENARLASKANGYEDEHAKFVKAMAEALGVPEGETRSLVGVASELRRHADAAKVNTNADVCAVEALEEMKARLEGMRETRDQATAKLAAAEIERGKALHHVMVLRNDVASLTRAFEERNKRVEEVEKENVRLIRIFDAVRALMVKR